MLRTIARVSMVGWFVVLAQASASADPILLVHDDSITDYNAAATTAQDVRPRAEQRGVGLDGTMRAGGAFPWAVRGNPFESGVQGERLESLRLATGAFVVSDIDLALPAQVPWVVGRSYNARQHSGGDHDSDGYQGRNWFQMSQPELVFFDEDANPSTRGVDDMIYLVYGADRFIEFRRTGNDEDTFRGVNGAAGVIVHESGSPDLYIYHDPQGNRAYFFGDNTSGDRADWQLWKFVDAAGNAAYAGHETSATDAVTVGYNADGSIAEAYDSAGRRYSYTYTAVDSVDRLTQVVAAFHDGSIWVEVGRVDYGYYSVSNDSHGKSGDLRLVTVTTPLSDPSEVLERRRYYRYYTGSYHATNNPGHEHTLKLVVGNEGVRRVIWEEFGDLDQATVDAQIDGINEGDLKPYADAFFKYDDQRRVVSVFFDGECGCSGGTNGEHRLTYETNSSHSATGYDSGWHTRVIVEPPPVITTPAAAWTTQYFDNAAQPLSRVLTNINPAGTSPETWATKVVRDADGRVTRVHTPANITGYNHTDGALTAHASEGLVWYYPRVSGGALDGFRTGLRQQAGDASLTANSTYTSSTQFGTRSIEVATGVSVVRPLVASTRSYHTATTDPDASANYDQTSRSYTWWESTDDTDVLYLTLKKAVTTAPAVSTANNGSGAATSTASYFRKDGTIAFTESARGIVAYSGYEDGRLTVSVEDAKTDTGTSYPSGEHPNTDFGIASSDAGLHRTTEYTYDPQGRLLDTDLPGGRTTRVWHTKLPDDRPVTFSIPKVSSFYGPAGYTVSNQSGNTDDCMTIAIDGGVTTEPLENWIDVVAEESEGPFDPIDPVASLKSSVGTVARLTSSIYGKTGRQLEERRVYFDIPSSLGSANEGEHYDAWRITYDNLGRRVTTTHPSGTIERTNYDTLGRVVSRETGTSLSGPNNMVTVEEIEYDGGTDGGNSLVTAARKPLEEGGEVVDRETTFIHDHRGRVVVTINPLAPHSVAKHDNLGRVVAAASYSDSAGLSVTTDPTSNTTDRVALSTMFYDERGRVWRSRRHEIDQSNGNDLDHVETRTWYDPDGRAIKTAGGSLTKTRYDRLGRVFQSFVLASSDDSVYSDVYDAANGYASITGDVVLDERRVGYDDQTGRVLVEATISRNHDDDVFTGTTGPLDTAFDGGDGDPLKFTAADIKGRIQITAHWYDDLDRPVTTAFYGTNHATENAGTFDRDGLTEPTASSASVIVTRTVYHTDGTVAESIDPKGRRTRYAYDDAGRVVATIANYTGASTPITGEVRDHDIYTRYAYEHGLRRFVWTDKTGGFTGGFPPSVGASDQVTEYIYGTTLQDPDEPMESGIASGHLLREVVYPEQEDMQPKADRAVRYAYNAQGQVIWTEDQDGNIIRTIHDELGRETARRVTSLATGYDGTVRRIGMTYLDRGMVDRVTQYNAPTAGSVVDEVQYTYDGWGNVLSFVQDVDPGNRDPFQVEYGYVNITPQQSPYIPTGLLRVTTELPGDTTVQTPFTAAKRVSQVRVSIGSDPFVTVAQYNYLGHAQLAGVTLPEPQARSNLFQGASGGNPYPMLDRFNRVASSRWESYKGTGERDFYRVDIAYDHDSNILSATDHIHKNASGDRNFDVLYAHDDLGRLTRAEEGELDGGGAGSISNRSRDERWLDSSGDLGLSQTGNWLHRRLDLDGDGQFNGTGELDETNQFNLANELIERDINSNSTPDYEPSYNLAGHQIDDGKDYEYVYDAFGRLMEVRDRVSKDLVAAYRYNGLNFRIGWHSDVTDDSGGDPDGVVDEHDPWFWFCYDDRWRVVAVFRDEDADPKEVFVHHNAGLAGYGGSSYIDSVILRDRDTSAAWHEGIGEISVRDERVYYAQNWRGDVSALLTDTGSMIEWVKYSAYGVPYALPAGDVDSNGSWSVQDEDTIAEAIEGGGAYDVRFDANLNGAIDYDDIAHANSIAGGYQTLGRGVQSSPAVANRVGYAGYRYDPTFKGASRTIYHVRHRVYDAEVGRWTRRDPLGYVDGMSLYEYVRSRPVRMVDPRGTDAAVGGGGGGCSGSHGCGSVATPPACDNEWSPDEFGFEFVDCPTSLTGEISQSLRNAIEEARRSCSRRGCPPLQIICAECDNPDAPPPFKVGKYTTGVVTGCNGGCADEVQICVDRGGGDGGWEATLIHELVHVRQCCDGDWNDNNTCEDIIRQEYEAYARARQCNPNSLGGRYDPRDCCSRACYSVPSSCYGGSWAECYRTCRQRSVRYRYRWF